MTASRRPGSRSNRGRRSRTWRCARLASWRTAGSDRPSASPISACVNPNASRSTNTARSSGESVSRTTSRAISTDSLADGVLERIDVGRDRLRQPLADVRLAAGLPAAEAIDREVRHDANEVGPRLADVGPVGALPAQPRLLDHVLGVGDLADDPIGDAREQVAVRLEFSERIGASQGRHDRTTRRPGATVTWRVSGR